MPPRKTARKHPAGPRKQITQADWVRLRNRLTRVSKQLGQARTVLKDAQQVLDAIAATPPGTYPNVTDKPPS